MLVNFLFYFLWNSYILKSDSYNLLSLFAFKNTIIYLFQKTGE